MINKTKVIEISATFAPFAVAQLGGGKKWIAGSAIAATAGIYIYNKWATPGYAPHRSPHLIPAIVLLGLYSGGIYVATRHPSKGAIIGAVTVAAIIASEYFLHRGGGNFNRPGTAQNPNARGPGASGAPATAAPSVLGNNAVTATVPPVNPD